MLSACPTENFPGQSSGEENGSQCRVCLPSIVLFSSCTKLHVIKFVKKKKKNQSSCKKKELLISQILIQNGVYMENQHDYGIKYQFCWYRIDSNNNKVIIVRKLVLV